MEVQGWKTMAGLECWGGRFWEGWGPGAVEDVAVDEARGELQEGSRAGDVGRGRYRWRDHGQELGAREERLEELLGSERGKDYINKMKEKVQDSNNTKSI